jgi:glutamine synthetase
LSGGGLLTGDLSQTFSQGYAVCNFDSGFGNLELRPDTQTLRRLAWLDSTALCLCDMVDPVTGEEFSQSPRTILKRQVARLEQRGYTAMFASELEMFLFDEGAASAGVKNWRNLSTTTPHHRYHMLGLTAIEEKVMRKIRNVAEASGIPLEGTIGKLIFAESKLREMRHPFKEFQASGRWDSRK